MTALVLALTAGMSWGVSDFLGGVGARRVTLPAVLAGSQVVAAAVVLPVLVLLGPPMPDVRVLVPALAGGVVAIVELGLLYLALRPGPTVVAAQVAALGAILPVVVGIAGGDPFGWVIAAGIVCALAGAAGASWPPRQGRPTRGAALISGGVALGAAAGTGVVLTLVAHVSRTNPWWAVGAVHAGGTATALAVWAACALARRARSPRGGRPAVLARRTRHLAGRRGGAVTVASIGLADLAADLAYAGAAHAGPLDVVAVLASLYPVATIALGVAVLRERPSRTQIAGLALACAAVAALATAR